MRGKNISVWKRISFITFLLLTLLFITQGCGGGSGGDSSGSKADTIPSSVQAPVGGSNDDGLGLVSSISSNLDAVASVGGSGADSSGTNVDTIPGSAPTVIGGGSGNGSVSASLNSVQANVGGPVFYVTQSGSGNGDGSSYTNAMSVAAHNNNSFLGDTIIYLCDTITSHVKPPSSGTSGHPIIYRGDYPGHPGVIDGNGETTYGLGKSGSIYLTYESITIQECSIAGIIVQPTSAVTTTPLYVTINNCTIRDIGVDATSGNGIDGRGVGLTVYNCTIYNIIYDGIYHSGAGATISYCNIYDVDQTTGTPGGDCIQLNGPSYWVHNNTLNHTSKATKHCFIAQNTSNIVGTTSVFEFNTCTSLNSRTTTRVATFEDSTNRQTVRNNTFSGGNYLITPLGSADIYNNNFSDTSTWAISIQGSTTAGSTFNIYNNTFYDMDTTSYGCITIPDVALRVIFNNNIVHSARNGVSRSGNSATIAADYNDFYNVTTKYNGCSGGAHDL